jgi:G2/mitotic-specific cyclin 1/2
VEVEATETEPARKKRKTSSPVPVAEDVRSAEEGVFAGGKEVVLSSGGRGTAVRSPKASRPKDYGWTDLDAEDEGDPSMVSEYVIDAFKYMVAIEVCFLPAHQCPSISTHVGFFANVQPQTMADPDYMSRQTAIDWEMRTILLEWLIEVHSKFRLLPETLFIAINLVDRFLAVRVVSLEKLQLVGLTAMFIAAKYEEVICPSINHFLHMTDESFELDEMLRAERYMLSTLQFDMSYPNPLNFLRRVSKADDYDIQTRTVAKFLIEIVAVKHELIGVQPSRLAAAAVWLARLCMERGDWVCLLSGS